LERKRYIVTKKKEVTMDPLVFSFNLRIFERGLRDLSDILFCRDFLTVVGDMGGYWCEIFS